MFGFISHKGGKASARPQMLFKPTLVGLEIRDTPAAPIATDDTYEVEAGSVLTVSAIDGVLKNDFSTSNSQAVLIARRVTDAVYVDPANPLANIRALPSNSLRFDLNGGFTFIAPSNNPPGINTVQFKYAAVDTNGDPTPSTQATVTITIVDQGDRSNLFATGAGPGSAPQVNVYESTSGNLRFSFFAYEQSFTGGVRVATGDLNGDGVDDIITSPAEGGSARIKVFDGQTQATIADFFVFEPTFRGGAEIAVGNVGRLPSETATPTAPATPPATELIVGAGVGGGPRVVVFSMVPTVQGSSLATLTPTQFSDFFAYEDSFRNGVRVASGRVLDDGGDGLDQIVTGAGAGGGPAVKVFTGDRTLGQTGPPANKAFFAFDPSTRGGVSVAVGQFRGDRLGDIVVGSGVTDTFRVFDGRTNAILRELSLPATDGSITPGVSGSGGSNAAGSSNFGGSGGFITSLGATGGTGGIRVAVTPRNTDPVSPADAPISDVVVGAASGTAPRVRIFDGNSLGEIDSFLAYPSTFLGGVFVGGNSL